MQKPKLCVALDVPDSGQARTILEELDGLPVVYKVGLELFIAEGKAFVKTLVSEKRSVFLDLKLHDIPNTVQNATMRAAELGVDFLTLHLAGGQAMCEAARDAIGKSGSSTKLLGVSVLTSFDEASWAGVSSAFTAQPAKLADTVLALVSCAERWGIPGVVASARELAFIRMRHPSLLTVIPGIRQKGSDSADQKRVLTPMEAAKEGAGMLVVGRPILEAKDRRSAVESLLTEIDCKP